MSSTTKFCKDCIHYDYNIKDIQPAGFCRQFVHAVNPVTGEKHYLWANVNRKLPSHLLFRKYCGPKGYHFSPVQKLNQIYDYDE